MPSCLVLAACLALAAPAATPPEPATPSITGTVRTAAGAPAAGAVVRALPARNRGAKPLVAETGKDGRFTLAVREATTYRLRVQASGHAPLSLSEIDPGATLTLALRPGHALAGRVLDVATREPIAGVTVRAADRQGPDFGEEALPRATTDAEGRFRLADLPAGLIDLEASGTQWARTVMRRVTVPPPPGARQLEISLQPGGTIAGRVLGTDDAPLEAVRLVLVSPTYDGSRDTSVTDVHGRFAVHGVPLGTPVRLHAYKEGWQRAVTEDLRLSRAGESHQLELRLAAASALVVTVLAPDGTAVPTLALEVEPAEGQERGWRQGFGEDDVDLDPDGRFRLEGLNLPSGTYDVTLLPEAFGPIELPSVTLRPGQTTDLGTLRAPAVPLVNGRVTDRAGAPVPKARVTGEWRDDERRSRSTHTDAQGRFRLPLPRDVELREISVAAEGFVRQAKEPTDEGEPLDVVLVRAGGIRGRVVQGDTASPAIAEVRVTGSTAGGDEASDRTTTDAAGAFAFESLDPGTWSVEAVGAGFAPARVKGVVVEPERVTDAGVLRLREGLTVRGRAVDAGTGEPVAGAAVTIEPPTPGMTMSVGGVPELGRSATSDGDGRFVLSGLEPGAWMVAVDHPSYAPTRARAEVDASPDRPEVVVRLSRGGTLSGTVRDGAGLPRPEVNIAVLAPARSSHHEATTDADGTYRMERLPAGDYLAMRLPQGGEDRSGGAFALRPVTIKEGETTVLDFDETAPITVTGRVLRGDTPVTAAMLVFLQGDPTPEAFLSGGARATQSDGSGAYRIGLDRPGRYTVVVQSEADGSGMTAMSTIDVPEEEQVVRDILVSAIAVAGVVLDAEGRPVAGAWVHVQAAAGAMQPVPPQRTGEDGTFVIEGLAAGTYDVQARADGYRLASVRVEIAATSAPLELRLEKGEMLRGRVLDPHGNPVRGAAISAAVSGAAPGRSVSSSSDDEGRFELTAPTASPVDLVVFAPGWAPTRLTGVMPPSDDAPEVIVRLDRGGTLRVHVRRADGTPVAGATVVPRPTGASEDERMLLLGQLTPTGADGVAVIELLAPGVYEVSLLSAENAPTVSTTVVGGGETSVTLVVPSP